MEEFIGRQVVITAEEIKRYSTSFFSIRPGISVSEILVCQRCGSRLEKYEHRLPSGKYFCSVCLKFGQLTSDDFLVSLIEAKKGRSVREVILSWHGQLTPLQAEIAKNLLENVRNQRDSLLWAVTGSGKTEMIFPVIYHVLSRGGRVCVTSPRIDVCRELYPRIQSAFDEEISLLLYGDSEESYHYCQLTVCTTHQLVHFYQAFDLIIVDEIDAFPYEGDPMLRYALQQALRSDGQQIYLTATPSNQLLAEVKEKFTIEKLPMRFHQRPLIVPECLWYGSWEVCHQKKFYLRKLLKYLHQLLIDNDVLVFCPSIHYMKRLYRKVSSYFAADEIASVHAQDEERKEKVENMREKKYRVLFTSTILERGVTFENVSVIVMGANHPVFTKSALVQIAGRVDRKGKFQKGRVLFFYNQNTQGIRQACQEIKEMNHLAKRWQEG